MKIKFMHVPLVILAIYISSIYTAENNASIQIKGQVRIGNCFPYFLEATGKKEFIKYIQKKLGSKHQEEKTHKNFFLPFSFEALVAQVSVDGKCTITDNKKQGHAIVSNKLGKIIFDTEKKEQIHDVSLNEGGNHRQKIELRMGDSITLKSLSPISGSPSIKITRNEECNGEMDSEYISSMRTLLNLLDKGSRNLDGTINSKIGSSINSLLHLLNRHLSGTIMVRKYPNLAGTRAAIFYKNLQVQIVNLESGNILFEGNNISGVCPSSTQKNILLFYEDCKTEMRSLEDGKIVCKDCNVDQIRINENATIVIFLYKNNRLAIKNLENGETLFEAKNIKHGTVTSKKILLEYKSGKQELIPISYFK